jgi:hypothetical protein
MAKPTSDPEYWSTDEQRRELEQLFARMFERHRREDERDERRRARLRRLSFGLLGRS